MLGFPLMIKAAAGGGGRGMRRVDSEDQVAEAFERARAEAAQAFGDPSVLMERLVGAARHVEVQLMADGEGGVSALGVRDCSYQRRHQKVVEESASPALSAEQERELSEAAIRLARTAGYRGAGTVEFLYEPESGRFSFMEVNTRLQVEHPVTEAVTAPTSSACSCTSRPAAGSRASRRHRAGTPSRSVSTPRTRAGASRPRRPDHVAAPARAAPASASTPASPRATPSRRSSTR